ncbi:MAG: rhomboid family intramembrane serine protease [Saprospiraceae bacterium]|nr:rhomboid family intramembrane serine protease [Saprospiraceae bacterium]
MLVTYIIIAVTALISFMAFNNPELSVKMRHWPYEEARRGEYYRWFTSGFLHADPMHLIFNMLTLLFFGASVEAKFSELFPGWGSAIYLIFYVAGIVAPSSATFYKYRNTSSFASIGASGAVAAVLFASILFNPTNKIYMFFIPIGIPGFIFGILYLWYSSYEAGRSRDNIDHTAHFFGAVFGFFFPLLFSPMLFPEFLAQIQAWISN